jgi:anti-sigma factor RsiW
MTCREFADFLMDYVDGELPLTQKVVFDHHLRACPNCEEYLRQYEITVFVAGRAFDVDSDRPVNAPEDLIRAILAARNQ